MPTNFPTSVDNFTNPTANDSLNLPSHSTQHANANDAIEAVEDYLLTNPFGLRLVKTQTIGSAVASVTVTNAFSATYDNYKILISGGNASADNLALGLQFTGITTAYYGTMVFSTYVGGGFQVVGTNNQASMPYVGAANTVSLFAQAEVNGPFLTEHKTVQSIFYDNTNVGRGQYNVFTTTSTTGFTISPNTGTLTGGTIYVYGYTKA